DVLNAYGGKCACCGVATKEFLAIDHINGGGRQHRLSLHPRPSSQTVYTWLRKNNYPEGFQVLCHNCNAAKSYYKNGCPHGKFLLKPRIFISPHPDDETLFGAYTLMREKPLVVIC